MFESGWTFGHFRGVPLRLHVSLLLLPLIALCFPAQNIPYLLSQAGIEGAQIMSRPMVVGFIFCVSLFISVLLHAGIIQERSLPPQGSTTSTVLDSTVRLGGSGTGPRTASDQGLRSSLRLVEQSDGSHAVIQSHVEDTRVLAMLTRDVPNRFSDLLGIQGKYGSDATCGNCQFFLHHNSKVQ